MELTDDVIAEGILRGCQGLFTPVSLGYPLSVFNENSTLKGNKQNAPTSISIIILLSLISNVFDPFGEII